MKGKSLSPMTGLNPQFVFKRHDYNISLFFQIWNHPDVLYEALQKENLANEQDLDVDDLGTNTRCQSQGSKVKVETGAFAALMGETGNSKILQGMGFNPGQEKANQVVTYEWVRSCFSPIYLMLL